MKLCRFLFGWLMVCVLAPAAFGAEPVCTQAFARFPDLVDKFKTVLVLRSVTIMSKAHSTITYEFGGPRANVYVDGKLVGTLDSDTVIAELSQDCPKGFLIGKSVPSSAKENTRSAALVQSLRAGQSNEDVAIADFNGDGVPDSAVLGGRSIFVTLQGADGTTVSTASYAVSGVGQSIVTADFNGDGLPDLAVTQGVFPTGVNPFPPGNVVVLLGKRDGTFGGPTMFPVGPVFNAYLATGDFNGDGIVDLALTHTVSAGAGRVAVLLGKGDGSFGPGVDYPVGPQPLTLVAADFNGDGKLDLASLDAFGSANKVWVLLGRGNGTFQPAVSTVSGTTQGHLAYADLNRDGKLDLVIADQRASAMEVMLGNGDGTFQAGKQYLIGAQPTSIAVLPLGDGNTSLITADNASNNLILSFVSSDGTVHNPELQTIGTGLAAVAAADLNGDRQPDLVITDAEAGKIYVKLASGKGQFASPVTYAVGSQPGALAISDLNGDGKPDVIAADTTGLDVLLGKGDGTLGPLNTVPVAGKLSSVTIADFNSDGKPDIAAANGAGGGVSLFLGNGNGTFQDVRTIPLINALAAVSGDFNGDGKPDLIVANGVVDFQTLGNLAVLLGKGDGTFQAPNNIALPGPFIPQSLGPGSTVALAAGDLNGDGKMDIVAVLFTGGGRSKIAVLLGKGDGTFQTPILTDSNTAPPAISIADLNGDGKPDLLLADCCGLTEASFLLGNGDGTFQAEVQFPSGPDPRGIAVADFNGDGKPDVAIIGQVRAVPNPNRGTLAILFNAFGTTASAANTASLVSAANPGAKTIAPGSLAIAYSKDLAQGTPGATALPLPTSFGGTTVSLVDSAGKQWQAPLIYVSAAQVNFLLPAGVATGTAQFTITSGTGTKSTATVPIAAVAPGLFTLNAANLVAATALRVSADETQRSQQVYSVNAAGAVVANPIDLGSDSDQVYLTLFGTGLQAAGTSGVKATVGPKDVPVQYAGPQGSFAGLDQVNVVLPHSLAGSGDVTVQLSAAGLAANAVRLTIQ